MERSIVVVLDTATLIYWTVDQPNLSSTAATTITNAQGIIISSISVWEIARKVKNGKLAIPLPVQAYVDLLRRANKVQIMPVTEEIWLKNVELAWSHRDPADRTIVATAILHGYPLISPDRQIQNFYAATIW
jgi:PIN domain nuclease of toxin-antitoxin system